MPFLFDTDAVSEVLKRRPAADYLKWIGHIPRADQFISAVTAGELYKGAFRSPDHQRHLRAIDERILPTVTVLPYDVGVARVFGHIQANLSLRGKTVADADLPRLCRIFEDVPQSPDGSGGSPRAFRRDRSTIS